MELVREIVASRLPALEHFEVWTGSSSYGADSTVDDVRPVLTGKGWEKVRYLGIRNSEYADEVAGALEGAAICRQLEVLDLSLGTLSDIGGEALVANAALRTLRKLDLHHNFLTEEVKAKILKVFPGADVTGEGEDYDDERFVAVGE